MTCWLMACPVDGCGYELSGVLPMPDEAIAAALEHALMHRRSPQLDFDAPPAIEDISGTL